MHQERLPSGLHLGRLVDPWTWTGKHWLPKISPSESSCIYSITAFSCSCCFHSDLFIISISFRIFRIVDVFSDLFLFGCWKLGFPASTFSRGSTPAAASLVVPAPSPDTVASNRREATDQLKAVWEVKEKWYFCKKTYMHIYIYKWYIKISIKKYEKAFNFHQLWCRSFWKMWENCQCCCRMVD